VTSEIRFMIVLVAAALCLAIGLAPAPAGVPDKALPAVALIGFTVTMWATGALPEFVASLLFLCISTVAVIAQPTAIFAGFSSPALWLVFGGLIVGAAADRTGLGLWVARAGFSRVGAGYGSMIAAVLIGSLLLSILVPSSVARLAIILTPVMAVARQAGLAPGSRGFEGAVIAVVFGNYLIGHGFLPANLTNILLLGNAGTMYGIEVSYGEYLLMNLPVIAVLRGVLVWALVVWMYRPETELKPVNSLEAPPLNDDGRKLLVIVAFALAVWGTDFVHGVAPGWVALVVAVICLMPGIDLVPSRLFVEKINMVTILFVAAVLGIGPVLLESGGGALLGSLIADLAGWEGQSPFYGYHAISVVSFLVALISNVSGSIAVVTPTVADLSQATGLPMKVAAMAQLNGLSSVLFPYQALPLMVGLAMGGVPMIKVVKFSVALSIIGLILLTPLNFAYWQWLGYIPG
jgi:di/tricarboxylate transporter